MRSKINFLTLTCNNYYVHYAAITILSLWQLKWKRIRNMPEDSRRDLVEMSSEIEAEYNIMIEN